VTDKLVQGNVCHRVFQLSPTLLMYLPYSCITTYIVCVRPTQP